MRVLELADRVRQRVKESGLPIQVIEVGGWQTRGYEFPARPDGAIRHWTAVGGAGRTTSLGAVTNGRTSPTPLAGPLCELYQSRNLAGYDDIYIVASGKANHAGEGEWNGIKPGNYQVLGLEIEWAGPTEDFPEKRKLVSEIAMRALMDCTAGTNDNDACEHREWALPRGRKIDTNLSGDELRRRMAELRAGSSAPATPSAEEDDMPETVMWFKDDEGGVHAYNVSGIIGRWLGPHSYDAAMYVKIPASNGPGNAYAANFRDTKALLDGPCRNVTVGIAISLLGIKPGENLLAEFRKMLAELPVGETPTNTQLENALKNALEATGLTGLLPGK